MADKLTEPKEEHLEEINEHLTENIWMLMEQEGYEMSEEVLEKFNNALMKMWSR